MPFAMLVPPDRRPCCTPEHRVSGVQGAAVCVERAGNASDRRERASAFGGLARVPQFRVVGEEAVREGNGGEHKAEPGKRVFS